MSPTLRPQLRLRLRGLECNLELGGGLRSCRMHVITRSGNLQKKKGGRAGARSALMLSSSSSSQHQRGQTCALAGGAGRGDESCRPFACPQRWGRARAEGGAVAALQVGFHPARAQRAGLGRHLRQTDGRQPGGHRDQAALGLHPPRLPGLQPPEGRYWPSHAAQRARCDPPTAHALVAVQAPTCWCTLASAPPASRTRRWCLRRPGGRPSSDCSIYQSPAALAIAGTA